MRAHNVLTSAVIHALKNNLSYTVQHIHSNLRSFRLVLKRLFLDASVHDKARRDRLAKKFEDPLTELYLFFVQFVITKIDEVNKHLQADAGAGIV